MVYGNFDSLFPLIYPNSAAPAGSDVPLVRTKVTEKTSEGFVQLDFASSIGPWLVTPDELADARSGKGYALSMTATVNGNELSRGRWADAQFSFGEMIARASADARLRPGDLIGSGTVGTGCLLEVRDEILKRYLEPGDVVSLSVERLGTLTTPIIERPMAR